MSASVVDPAERQLDDANRSIQLSAADIHLWVVSYDAIIDARLHDAYAALLTPAERDQQRRFYFERDRLRYLVTRALVRTVLSRYAPVRPERWSFAANAYGRPEIVNADARDAGLSFNLSHTHSLIVLGVTRGRAIGVDVENVCARQPCLDVADRYFAPTEVAALSRVPRHRQAYRFFEYWTFKEAYIKARGMGLSLPLDKFSLDYPDDRRVALTIDPELADDAGRWQLWQFQPAHEYLVAVCAERIGIQQPTIVVRRTIPLLADAVVPQAFLRVSAPTNNRRVE